MFRSVSCLLACLCVPVPAQDVKPATPVPPGLRQDPAFTVTVPSWPNSTCPIMGKKVSLKLFTDVEYGRIYICCKGCDKKINNDVEAAYKTAYPTTKQIENKVCPVKGRPIGEEYHAVILQGHEFKVCSKACIKEAQGNAQIVLAKVLDDRIVDLENKTCPVTGEPVAKNSFAVVGTTLVRLSSPECVEAVEKDPRALVAKAKASVKQREPGPDAGKKPADAQGKKGESDHDHR
jgi:hypothetical protein